MPARASHNGKRYGRFIVISDAPDHKTQGGQTVRRVLCRCVCGTEKIIRLCDLSSGGSISCGCYKKEYGHPARKVLIGQFFGRLKVLGLDGRKSFPSGKVEQVWKCLCVCGNFLAVMQGHLSGGHTQSCGCYHQERILETNIKHGLSRRDHRHPLYDMWKGIRQRCRNPKHQDFLDYGGRGILLCERWESFRNFIEDMGERPAGTSIDRKNNDGNYEPGNCRWATPKQQRHNQRPLPK